MTDRQLSRRTLLGLEWPAGECGLVPYLHAERLAGEAGGPPVTKATFLFFDCFFIIIINISYFKVKR